MQRLKRFIIIVAVIAVVPILYFVISHSANLVEQEECYSWARQAKEYPDFYLTEWQQQQCNSHGIEVTEEEVWEN